MISPQAYDKIVGLMLFCPMSTKIKDNHFEFEITGTTKNVAISDQITSVNWQGTKIAYKGKAAAKGIELVRSKLKVLV